jgi:Flp pilus assembly pilin Flp
MRSLLRTLWKDDGGAVLAIEFILFVVIVLFGLIVGYVAVRNAIVAELSAVASAVADLSVCFSFAGLTNCEASVCGSVVIPLPSTPIIPGKTPASDISFVTVNPCQ